MAIHRRVRRLPACLLAVAGALLAQEPAGKAARDVERRARSLCNQLELAERRGAAADELLALGAASVPALAARLNDPRPPVVQAMCEVLCALGTVAAPALPQLVTVAGSPSPAIVRMALLTELAVRPTGHTTVCEFERQRIVQIAADGTERELLTGRMAWDFDLLPGGGLLITDYMGNEVVEFDEKGEKVWSFGEVRNPLDADRLLDGNTLIADMRNERVIEVSADGKVVWEFKVVGRSPYEADRLANGNTLITVFPDRVLEVNRAGETVWELGSLEGVFEADRLPDGNTLLTLYQAGAVREVDRAGKTVWEGKGLRQPNCADRLPNGNTVVGTANSVVELGPDGAVIGKLERGKRVSRLWRR